MIPIKIIFTSGNSITVYSEDPDFFAQCVSNIKPIEIIQLEYDYDIKGKPPELEEVKLTLSSGPFLLCNITKEQFAEIHTIQEIVECDKSNVIAYTKLANEEAELDQRFFSATAVINNLPNLDLRLEIHKQYIKRKSAYVAALEALVDSVIRRPE